MIQAKAESYEAGRVAGAGSFICSGCNYKVVLETLDSVPECPACGGTSFRRGSMFDLDPEKMDQPTIDHTLAGEGANPERGWLTDARAELPEAGHFLAFRDDDDGVHVIELGEGWSRIGRSFTADIRLDDPTVSRRHALIVKTGDGRIRILDDRSLNGVYVNGRKVEWRRLSDGDEIAVGRYHLHLLDAAPGRRESSPARKQGAQRASHVSDR